MSRRIRFGVLTAAVVFLITILYLSLSGHSGEANGAGALQHSTSHDRTEVSTPAGGLTDLPAAVLTGGVIAPKLGNATAKQELGRASWRLLHTMMARFPDKPTADDSLALKSFIQLFARLYPCGECAAHFQKLLDKYPPQTSSRNNAAGWACFVHNEVNTRLGKEIFDCNKIGDFYDCGCAEDDEKGGKGKSKDKASDSSSDSGKETPFKGKSTDDEGMIKLEKEGDHKASFKGIFFGAHIRGSPGKT